MGGNPKDPITGRRKKSPPKESSNENFGPKKSKSKKRKRKSSDSASDSEKGPSQGSFSISEKDAYSADGTLLDADISLVTFSGKSHISSLDREGDLQLSQEQETESVDFDENGSNSEDHDRATETESSECGEEEPNPEQHDSDSCELEDNVQNREEFDIKSGNLSDTVPYTAIQGKELINLEANVLSCESQETRLPDKDNFDTMVKAKDSAVHLSRVIELIRARFIDKSICDVTFTDGSDFGTKVASSSILHFYRIRKKPNFMESKTFSIPKMTAAHVKVLEFLHTDDVMSSSDFCTFLVELEEGIVNEFVLGLMMIHNLNHIEFGTKGIPALKSTMEKMKSETYKNILDKCNGCFKSKETNFISVYRYISSLEWSNVTDVDGHESDGVSISEKLHLYYLLYGEMVKGIKTPGPLQVMMCSTHFVRSLDHDVTVLASDGNSKNVSKTSLCSFVLQIAQSTKWKEIGKDDILILNLANGNLDSIIKIFSKYVLKLADLKPGDHDNIVRICTYFMVPKPLEFVYGAQGPDSPEYVKTFLDYFLHTNDRSSIDMIRRDPTKYLTNDAMKLLTCRQMEAVLQLDDIELDEPQVMNIVHEFCNTPAAKEEDVQLRGKESRIAHMRKAIRFGLLSYGQLAILQKALELGLLFEHEVDQFTLHIAFSGKRGSIPHGFVNCARMFMEQSGTVAYQDGDDIKFRQFLVDSYILESQGHGATGGITRQIMIRLYGRTENNRSVVCHVAGFLPIEDGSCEVRQFMTSKKMWTFCGIDIPPGKIRTINGHDCHTLCDVEIQVDVDDFNVIQLDGKLSLMALPVMMAFDIECECRYPILSDPNVDSVIKIGCAFYERGSVIPFRKVMLSYLDCDEIDDAEVECFETEVELLLAFKNLVKNQDPEIILGYNVINFDLRYLIERAANLGILAFNDFGRYSGSVAGVQECPKKERFEFPQQYLVNVPGRILLDVFYLVLRFMNYQRSKGCHTLERVSLDVLKEEKDDVKPHEISILQKESKSGRTKLAKYCMKDLDLAYRICEKKGLAGKAVNAAIKCGSQLHEFLGTGFKTDPSVFMK